jgi:NNP family nitrate/nitrite transporter-like MFS transporter
MIPALGLATKQASAALGVVGAMGAIGGFLIPVAFSAPWVDDPLGATKGAFLVFTGYYVACAVVTYAVYLRRPARAAALVTGGV